MNVITFWRWDPDYLKTVIWNGSLGVDLLAPVQFPERNRDQGIALAAGSVQLRDCMVRPEGLEPPTPRSVVWCSIH